MENAYSPSSHYSIPANDLAMKAVYFRHVCFLVKDQCTIEVLQKSGLGARLLNPIITSAESVEADDASPLLLLDEEVNFLCTLRCVVILIASIPF